MQALLMRALLIASKIFGISSAARMAMTASTPIISISVKAALRVLLMMIFIVLGRIFEVCFASATLRQPAEHQQVFEVRRAAGRGPKNLTWLKTSAREGPERFGQSRRSDCKP